VTQLLALPTRHPAWVLLVTLGLAALLGSRVFAWPGPHLALALDPSVDRLLPDGDEARAFYDEASRRFGTRDALLVVLVGDRIFSPEGLAAVDRVTRRLAALQSVDRVLSLANALDVRSEDGDVVIEPFLVSLPRDAAGAERVRRGVMDNPIYAGNLVSRDGRAAALLVTLRPTTSGEVYAQETDLRILDEARQAAGDLEVLFTGGPHVEAETTRIVFHDLRVVLPVALILLCGTGLLANPSPLGALAPLATVLVALLWTLGAVAWLGGSLDLVSASVPLLLVTIGFAYAIHVVSAWREARREAPHALEAAGGAVALALRHVALPVALTGLTTVAGFLALTLAPFGAVRSFGWMSVGGVSATVLASLSFTPALLQLFGARERPRSPRADPSERLLEALGRAVLRHRRAVLAAGAALALLGVLGALRIHVNTDVISNFPPDHPVRSDVDRINAELEGANPFSIVLSSEQKDAFVQPENLAEVEKLQRWLAEQPEVGGSTSLVDYLKVLHRALRDGDEAAFAIPDRARLVKQLLFFGASDELDGFVDAHYAAARVRVRSRTLDTSSSAHLLERLDARLAELPGHLEGRATGSAVLLAQAMDDVSRGQAETLGVALLIIYALLVGLFTSFRVGLVALIPNALPVLIYFGALGWLGIGLNTTTGILACVILGIAVDDTIHFLTRFNAVARELGDERRGAVEALRGVGRPVTLSTAGLCVGFLAVASSELQSQSDFGLLGACTLAFAWLVDMTFTPALCAGMKGVTLWDALTLDLGRDPQHSLPVLRGLSKTQARIAALMTRVVRIPAGTRVIHAGEAGDCLYVVIEGELAASLDTPGGRVEFARARRGDVMGEVGLYHGVRTADVDAVEDVRALRFTRANLERLRNRYPRIGAVVFWNLSELLARRVANTTAKVEEAARVGA
jgi:predicted RND superfamily exporter protein